MTDAGWTCERPTVAGWYWWRWSKKDDPEVLWLSLIAGKLRVFTMSNDNCEEYVDDYDGEWLGPLSPTDRQQGFQGGCVEGLRRAGIAYAQWINNEYRPSDYARFEDWCEMEAQHIEQAAQDE